MSCAVYSCLNNFNITRLLSRTGLGLAEAALLAADGCGNIIPYDTDDIDVSRLMSLHKIVQVVFYIVWDFCVF